MKRTTMAILSLLLFSISGAASAVVKVDAWAAFSGSPRGSLQGAPLNYIFEGVAGVTVLSYRSPYDSFKPLILNGSIENKQVLFSFFNYWSNVMQCGQTGVVSEVQMVCHMAGRIPCPAADGWWRTKNKTVYGLGNVAVNVTPHYRAQCVEVPGPGTCALAPAAATITMDLNDGSIQRRAIPEDSRGTLDRLEEKDGMSYTFERWSFEQAGDTSPVRARRRDGQGRPGHRNLSRSGVLRIDIPALPDGHQTTPTVAFREPHSGTSLEAGARALVRAEFSPTGGLEEVDTLLGPPSIGNLLGEGLEVRSAGADHRTVVYALFEGLPGGRSSELRVAVPILPRCCCGSVFCQ